MGESEQVIVKLTVEIENLNKWLELIAEHLDAIARKRFD